MARDVDTTCFNCGDELAECQCGNTKTYDNREGPICPFCGHLNKASDSDGLLYNEGLDDYECDACGKRFYLSICISFSWSATRPDSEES